MVTFTNITNRAYKCFLNIYLCIYISIYLHIYTNDINKLLRNIHIYCKVTMYIFLGKHVYLNKVLIPYQCFIFYSASISIHMVKFKTQRVCRQIKNNWKATKIDSSSFSNESPYLSPSLPLSLTLSKKRENAALCCIIREDS